MVDTAVASVIAANNEYPAPGHDDDFNSAIIESEEDDDVPVDGHGNNCNNYGGSHSNAHRLANDEPHYSVNAITNDVTITSTTTTDNTNIHNSTKHHLDDNNNSSSIPRTTSVIDQSKYSRPGRPKYAAQSELYHGMILYLSAILIPSLPRYIHQLYIRWVSSTYCRILHEQVLWCVWVLWRIGMFFLWKVRRWMVGSWMFLWSRITFSTSTVPSSSPQLSSSFPYTTSTSLGSSSGLVSRRLGRKIRKYIFSTSTAALWEEFNRQQQQHHVHTAASTRFNNTTQRYLFVPPSIRIMVLQDMQLLILLSIILAIVRVWFVHMLVPEYLVEVRQLEALTRCKSSHLLSNSSQNLLSLGGGGGGNCSGSKSVERHPRLDGNEDENQWVLIAGKTMGGLIGLGHGHCSIYIGFSHLSTALLDMSPRRGTMT